MLDRLRVLAMSLTLLIVDEVSHVLRCLFTNFVNIIYELLLLFLNHSEYLLNSILHLYPLGVELVLHDLFQRTYLYV